MELDPYKLKNVQEELEIKRTRVNKGWVHKGEKYCCPITGKNFDLTHDNLKKSLDLCSTELKKHHEAHKVKRRLIITANILTIFLVVGILGWMGWHYTAVSAITGFAISEALSDTGPLPIESSTDNVRERIAVSAQEKDIRTDNHPPAFGKLDSLSVEGKMVLDLRDYVKDEDNDELTFISTQPEGVSVEWKDSIVTISPVKEGKGTIIFFASDSQDMTRREVPISFKPRG